MPIKEAAERLKQGDGAFILEAPRERLGELTRLHPSAPFYAGLLVRGMAAEDAGVRAAVLFEAALENPSPRLREEAARELILPLLEAELPGKNGVSLPIRVLGTLQKKKHPPLLPLERTAMGAALYRLGRYQAIEELYQANALENSWDRAILSLAALALQKNAEGKALLPFFLEGSPDRSYRWAFDEALDSGAGLFSEAEEAAVAGRLAVDRSGYGEALRRFRVVLDQEPELFFQYPGLTGDLGRAFQFAGSGEEGLKLFLDWEIDLEKGRRRGPGDLRYRLLYYAGRIARQMGRLPQGIALFNRALAFAPDPVQKDACIWYILSLTLTNSPEDAASLVKDYFLLWHDDTYFADLLDQLSRYLTMKRRWKALAEIFSLIRPGKDGASIAKYAWILGRALEEGYLSPAEAASFGEGIPASREEAADAFFKIAFEEGQASFYYRALSASRLGGAVVVTGTETTSTVRAPKKEASDDLAFLRGFFDYGGAALVPAYLEGMAGNLSIPELRQVAEALEKAGEWRESIRQAANYMSRPDYELSRRDLELHYPRPYRELIEGNAEGAALAPEILYGLIRTESTFVPGIVSWAGAVGLSQLMDATAREMAGRIARQGGPDYLEGERFDLTDPELNVHIGAFYLNYLIDRMGSPLLALLAYNGGMGRVRRWRAAEPSLPEDLFLETIEYPETREYGRRVLAAAAAYGYLYYDLSMEAVIADIFRR